MTAHRRASGAASGVADAPAQGHALLLSCSFGANSNGVSVSCGYDGNDRVTGIGYTRGVETLKSIDLDYDGNGNVVRKNDSSYGYDERDMLLEADMHDRFAADIRESQTAGIATRDVSGQGELVCPEVESTFELDVNANSVGVDLGRNREVYGIVVTPAGVGNRLAKDNLEVWLRGSGQATWDELSRDDYVVEKDAQGGMDIRFRVPLAARYAKLHQLFDERNVEDQDVGVPTVTNVASVLLKLRYFVADRVESYSYDAAGKRQSLGVTFDGQARPGVSYSYYAGSELLKSDGRWGYRYDGNGNLVEKGEYWADGGTEITVQHPAGSAAWRYGWDLYNRLVKVERWEEGSYAVVASYQYNHRGLRVHRIGSDGLTRYLYDQEGNVVLTSYADGSSEQQVWVGGKLVQRIARDAAGAEVARRYLSTDHLGTVVMVTDEAGQIVSEGNYTPFGEDAGPSGLEELALRYTGKDVDPDTCLVYVNARWLDTSTGRFISEDPVLDGTLWFAYVNNNPLTLVDPSGMEGQREESGSLEVRKGWITKSFSREIPVSNGPAVSKLFVTLTASVEIKTERFLETGRLASYSFTGAVYAEHRIDYGADWTVLAMSRPNVTCEVADRRFGRAITGVSVEATSIATRERDVLGAIGGLAWELVGPNFDPLNPDDAIRAYDLGEEFLDQLRASPLIGAGLDLLDLLVNSEEFMEQYGALMEQTRVSVSFSLEDAQKARELAATPPTAQLDSTGESPLLLTERQHPWMPEE